VHLRHRCRRSARHRGEARSSGLLLGSAVTSALLGDYLAIVTLFFGQVFVELCCSTSTA
jgi:ABC-type branched-subunit amino acid transport system permease subunit